MAILLNYKRSFWVLIPLAGSTIFIIFYIVGTLLYPGGSQVDHHSEGFSWMNNYWCNLLNKYAINGQHNPARPIAMMGMFVLCFTLAVFWYFFPIYTRFTKYSKLTIQISGLFSMTVAMFVYTNLHDSIIYTAGFFGVIAILGTFVGLYRSKWYGLFLFGVFNLLLLFVNNYIYYTKDYILYLPLIQKISFASFLLWVCYIDISLFWKKEYSKRLSKELIKEN